MKAITNDQITLFLSLFDIRQDIYAKYWEDLTNKKCGYAPVFRLNQGENILTESVILAHLHGEQTIGVYPLFSDNTTSFLAIDFDGEDWLLLINKVIEVASAYNLYASIEKSKSGEGGHLWFFFTNKIPAYKIRFLGKLLLDRANIKSRKTYDRMFPSQDEHTGKGYGNLICLPLQGNFVDEEKTVFVTLEGKMIQDQWVYLQTIKKIDENTINKCVQELTQKHDQSQILAKTNSINAVENSAKDDNEEIELTVPTSQDLKTKLILSSCIYIPSGFLPDKLYKFLKRELNFPNPEFYAKERYGYSTWQTPRFIKTLEINSDGILVPIGFLEKLLEFCKKENIDTELLDQGITTKSLSFSSKLILRKDQRKILSQIYKHDRAILEAPPGFGKTMVALALMKKRKQKTLIIVHTNTLLHQWYKRIGDYFKSSKEDIGLIGENKWKIGKKVTVASYMTLARRGIEDIKNEFGFIIVDECHHVPANTFSAVIKEFPAKYALGLTATGFRKDKLEKLMHLYISDQIIATESDEKVESKQENTIKTELITRKTRFQIKGRVADFQEASRLVISDPQRNLQIVTDVCEVLTTGAKCLILTERIEHGEHMYELIRQKTKGIHGAIATGIMTKKEREKIANRMHQERFQFLIATGKLIGEGFDWPEVSHLFLAFPFSWKGKLIQYVGRVQRTHEGKEIAVVHDYFDEEVTMLKLMYYKRLRTYRSLGLAKSNMQISRRSTNDKQLRLL